MSGQLGWELPEDLRPGETVLISACLAGEATRWDGGHNRASALLSALEAAGAVVVTVCPEMLGGLPAPRPPAEPPAGDGRAVLAGRQPILTVGEAPGADVTAAFRAGAEATLAIARQHQVRYAWFQDRSPSCGVHQTHSGGTVVPGPGLTTALLEGEVDVRTGSDID